MSGLIENDNGIIQNQIPQQSALFLWNYMLVVGDYSPAVRNDSKDRNEVRIEDPVGFPSSTDRTSCTTARVNRIIDFRCKDPG